MDWLMLVVYIRLSIEILYSISSCETFKIYDFHQIIE